MNRRALSLAFSALLDEWETHVIAKEILAARGIKVRPADLSEWANAKIDRTAPTHVVSALEEVCGKPVVSAAMAASILGVSNETVCLTVLSSDATLAAAEANAIVARANADEIISNREEDESILAIRAVISRYEALAQEVSAKASASRQAAQ